MASLKKLYYRTLRFSHFNDIFLHSFIRGKTVDRLHMGCGPVLLPGWCNILYERDKEYGKPKMRNGAWFLNYNLLTSWPWMENSIRFIAAAHFIEHLDLDKCLEFCTNAFTILAPGGVLRLSCPDLEMYAKNYCAGNETFFNDEYIKKFCFAREARTPSQIFASKAYDNGGHKWFHDFASIKNVLERCGFTTIRKCNRLEGKTPDLHLLELPEREIETLYLEAEK
jgi:predicted SAM-dependent methyltransferase